jgi:hypothetical protein
MIFSAYDLPLEELVNFKVPFTQTDEYRFDISSYMLEVEENVGIEINAFFCMNNLNYSLSIQSENQHIFSVYGFIKELNSGDPTIMYTVKNGHVLQLSIGI